MYNLPVCAVETSFPLSMRRFAIDILKHFCLLFVPLSPPDETADGTLTVQSIPLENRHKKTPILTLH